MKSFKSKLEIIGVNPFLVIPDKILNEIFIRAGKDKGYIPVKGLINGKSYKQTLVRYKGAWRFYVNTTMLSKSPQRIGETIKITIDFDPVSRNIEPHPKFLKALKENKTATKVFESLTQSRKKEILRYIGSLKTEESRDRNIARALRFLNGKDRFVGRDNP